MNKIKVVIVAENDEIYGMVEESPVENAELFNKKRKCLDVWSLTND
ncbi:hypothetical protein OU798_22795 [Prolixibacteraceae bacterium Z1-6]|uniref:Uncharacterized protein n=1 Tax=Draconibacterium aestuarii TaxID=2998507 RepID=A0A9X3J9X3_9BACT|nr:hypothetical protein [Prolixibacteraceae bacterium Z1-6]